MERLQIALMAAVLLGGLMLLLGTPLSPLIYTLF